MTNILREIDAYVKGEMEKMNHNQLGTLRALLFSGYKGEREEVLIELLKKLGEEDVSQSSLIEYFASSLEDKTLITYWRIKPEFFRAVRKNLF
jgi:hypothetical protein